MKALSRIAVCLALVAVFGVAVSYSQSRPRVSQRGYLEQAIGSAQIKITYHRPNMKGRVLWGSKDALVPDGKVWRSGANEATVFEVTEDVTVNGMPLPAGKYSFYTIPSGKEWTIIFNKSWDQWGTVYDQKADALRVMSKPTMSEESKETLAYQIEDVKANSAVIVLTWGKMRVPFTVMTGN